MLKNIAIVFLCFTLLYATFFPAYLQDSPSIYDKNDGSVQIVHWGSAFRGYSCPIYSGDYLIDYEELYVFDNDILSFQNIEGPLRGYFVENSTLQSMSDDFYKNIYDFISHYYENWDLYYFPNPNDEHYDCYPFADDGKIELFYSYYDPHSSVKGYKHPELAGDFWYNRIFEKCYVYDGFEWQEVMYNNPVLDVKLTEFYSDKAFEFGYELTIGTFEVVTSIFKGSDAFFSRFDQWKETLFGDIKLFDFLFGFIERVIQALIDWIDTAVDELNVLVDKLPVIGPLKRFMDSCFDVLMRLIQNVIAPLEESFADLVQWIKDKL